jgi:hypothetical protein
MAEVGKSPTESFLLSRDLQVKRFDNVGKRGEKTPDFKVTSPEDVFFYCEVKSITSERFNEELKTSTANNRLASNIHQATKQFKAENSLHLVPNVLAWNSLDPRYNISKLHDLLKGEITLEGKTLANLKKYKNRIHKDLPSIDLHIWLYPWGEPDYIFTPSNQKFLNDLQRALKVDVSGLQPIP